MAQSVNRLAKSIVLQGGLSLCVACIAGAAVAQALMDPTRPPASMGNQQEGRATVSSGPVLQSVLISPARRVAIISGEAVSVGGKYGEATVIKITEGEVVLLNGRDQQTLKLFPDVEKRLSSSRDRSPADSRRQ